MKQIPLTIGVSHSLHPLLGHQLPWIGPLSPARRAGIRSCYHCVCGSQAVFGEYWWSGAGPCNGPVTPSGLWGWGVILFSQESKLILTHCVSTIGFCFWAMWLPTVLRFGSSAGGEEHCDWAEPGAQQELSSFFPPTYTYQAPTACMGGARTGDRALAKP